MIRHRASLLALALLASTAALAVEKKPLMLEPLGTSFSDQPNPADPAQQAARFDESKPILCPGLTPDPLRRAALHQGADGYFFRSGDFQENLQFPPQLIRSLQRLDAVLKARGSRLVLAPLPTRGQVGRDHLGTLDADTVYNPAEADATDAEFRASMTAAGLHTVPALPPEALADFFFKRDHHWRPEAARLFANQVAGYLNSLPGIADLPRLAFTTKQLETDALPSKLGDQIRAVCSPVPYEQVTHYRTEQSAESADDLFGEPSATDAGADALFGDAGAPAIALIGTSYSAMPDYHFEGALLQESRLQVVNYAVSGGEAWSSMLHYLSSPGWRDTPSPILLWEFQRSEATLKQSTMALRQIIPAAKGLCTGAAVGATARGPLGGNQTLDLSSGKDKALQGPDAYIVVRFASPSVRSLNALITYADGQIEEVPVNRHERMPPNDTFTLELSADFDAPLASISLSIPGETPIAAEATLCSSAPPTP